MKGNILHPIHKSLVIGLGGTGKRTLVQLKHRIMEAGYADTPFQPEVGFICLDFDSFEETASIEASDGRVVRLAPDEMCYLNAEKIQNRLKHINEEQNIGFFQDWYPDLEENIIRMGSHRVGAAQWRLLGRIGFFEYVERVQMVLRRTINRLLEVEVQKDTSESSGQVVVYLVSSLAGGTGSGILLDVAYFIRRLPINIRQIGLFLLPGIYAEHDISGRLFANSYASLKELTAFANQTEPFHARYPNGNQIKVEALGEAPIDLIFLYDNIIGDDRLTTNAALMSSIMAETIFLDLEEGRLSRAQESILTNIQTQAGGKQLDTLAGRSVFNTIGTLTLCLPPLRDIRQYWSDKFVAEILVPDMENIQSAGIIKEGEEPPDEAINADKFPEIEDTINNAVAETIEACKEWPEEFIHEAGESLGEEVLKFITTPELAIKRLERWLEQFLSPRPEGDFEVPPGRLPDIFLEGKGPLRNSVLKLEDKLKRALDQKMPAGTENHDQTAEELFLYLRSKAAILRGKVNKETVELKDLISREKTPIHELKSDLLDLFRAHPWKLGGIDRMAASHWARRFLRQMREYYSLYARHIRVNILLAQVIDRARQEKIVDDEFFKAFIRRREAVKVEAQTSVERLLQQSEAHTSLIVRSLSNRHFWNKSWEAVSSMIDRTGNVIGFMLYLRKTDDLSARQGDMSTKELFSRMADFAKQKVKVATKDRTAEILELFAYIDNEVLKKELANTRHDFMITNTIENPNERNVVYALSPAYSPASEERKSGFHYTALWGLLNNTLEASTLNLRTYDAIEIPDDEPGRIIIRHVSLNHPTYNLKGIREYYYAYSRYGKNHKLFHVDKRFDLFPEVIVPSQEERFPVCGNPDCSHDLSDVPRDEIFCPACKRPIRNRCGNIDCLEDELHRKPEMSGAKPDKYCPTCGKLARTYWWWCDKHNIHIFTESKYCLKCLEEYGDGIITSFEDVRTRDDVEPHFGCPGCEHDCIENPFKIKFIDVYDHVPDDKLDKAWEIYYSKTTRRGYCPQCGAQLLPFCPYCDPVEEPHFVQRTTKKKGINRCDENVKQKGVFFCTNDQDHAQKCIAECSYCGLPLKEDAKYCPRCKRSIKDYLPKDDEKDEAKRLILKERKLWFGKAEKEKKPRRCDRFEKKAMADLEINLNESREEDNSESGEGEQGQSADKATGSTGPDGGPTRKAGQNTGKSSDQKAHFNRGKRDERDEEAS